MNGHARPGRRKVHGRMRVARNIGECNAYAVVRIDLQVEWNKLAVRSGYITAIAADDGPIFHEFYRNQFEITRVYLLDAILKFIWPPFPAGKTPRCCRRQDD